MEGAAEAGARVIPGTSFRVAQVFTLAFHLLRKRPVVVIAFSMLFSLPAAILLHLQTLEPSIGQWEALDAFPAMALLAAAIALFLQFATAGPVSIAAYSLVQEQKVSPAALLRAGIARLLPVMATAAIVAVAVSCGLFAFIVPALLALVLYAVAASAAAVERTGALRSLARSRLLTKGNRLKVLGILVVLYAARFGLQEATGVLPLISSFGLLQNPFVISALVTIDNAFTSVVIAAVYVRLRSAREGPPAKEIASVFD